MGELHAAFGRQRVEPVCQLLSQANRKMTVLAGVGLVVDGLPGLLFEPLNSLLAWSSRSFLVALDRLSDRVGDVYRVCAVGFHWVRTRDQGSKVDEDPPEVRCGRYHTFLRQPFEIVRKV